VKTDRGQTDSGGFCDDKAKERTKEKKTKKKDERNVAQQIQQTTTTTTTKVCENKSYYIQIKQIMVAGDKRRR